MESSSAMVPFSLLTTPVESTYRPCTIPYRFPSDPPRKATPIEIAWIELFEKSIPSFRKHAESDDTVVDAREKAEKFAQRYTEILQELKADPESQGGPPDCIDEENAKAITLVLEVVRINDPIEDGCKRIESLVREIFAGNIFDLGSTQLAEIFAKDWMSFMASCENLLPRPWVIDDLDILKLKWSRKSWKKVVLAANDLPSINDITHLELIEIISKLKDEKGQILGVDTSGLLIANSGNDLLVIDLSYMSPELSYLANDADLVILEGMGRGIETNLYSQFKCDSLKIGMVKHPEVAQFLGGRLYDCVFKYTEVISN